jgi:hypothetical protein
MNPNGKEQYETKVIQKVQRQKLCAEIANITGTGTDVARVLAAQLACGLALPDWSDNEGRLIRACSILAEYKPSNIVEAQLVGQMVATHECAMKAMERAMDRQQSSEAIDMNIKRAARMMQLHLGQIEVWQRLKGRAAQQRVTVEHVHVHPGGQAIVGTVNTNKTERREGDAK